MWTSTPYLLHYIPHTFYTTACLPTAYHTAHLACLQAPSPRAHTPRNTAPARTPPATPPRLAHITCHHALLPHHAAATTCHRIPRAQRAAALHCHAHATCPPLLPPPARTLPALRALTARHRAHAHGAHHTLAYATLLLRCAAPFAALHTTRHTTPLRHTHTYAPPVCRTTLHAPRCRCAVYAAIRLPCYACCHTRRLARRRLPLRRVSAYHTTAHLPAPGAGALRTRMPAIRSRRLPPHLPATPWLVGCHRLVPCCLLLTLLPVPAPHTCLCARLPFFIPTLPSFCSASCTAHLSRRCAYLAAAACRCLRLCLIPATIPAYRYLQRMFISFTTHTATARYHTYHHTTCLPHPHRLTTCCRYRRAATARWAVYPIPPPARVPATAVPLPRRASRVRHTHVCWHFTTAAPATPCLPFRCCLPFCC